MPRLAPQTVLIPEEATRAHLDRRGMLVGGAFSGLVAGAVMFMVSCIMAYAAELGPAQPGRLVAATFLREGYVSGGVGAFALGLAVHLAVAAAWGVAFAALVTLRSAGRSALLGGLVFGLIVWAVMTFGVVPLANPFLGEVAAIFPWGWLVLHLVFGAGLALAPALRREALD